MWFNSRRQGKLDVIKEMNEEDGGMQGPDPNGGMMGADME
jgi:hypothetical protein